jgi:preprotein translocase subunit SecB
MTKPSPLNASPLRLHGHRFTEVSVKASEQADPQGGFSLRTLRTIRDHTENPRMFLLILRVELGSSTPDQESPYTANLTIEGEFEVFEGYTAGSPDELVNITGASMLYGACREMLANLTARSTHGMSTLPSVSFGPPRLAPKAAVKKTAAKKQAKRKA